MTYTKRSEKLNKLGTRNEDAYGCFQDEGACYLINKPDTPRAWNNYLYSRDGKFQVVVSQRGQGQSFYITEDANIFSYGRNYCLLDKTSGNSWSLNGGDAPLSPESYQCEHYPGKTIFKTTKLGIESEIIIAVTPDDYIEINKVILRNTSKTDKQLSLIGLYENLLNGIGNSDQIEQTCFDNETGAVLAQRSHFTTPKYKYASFYVSNKKPNSYCGTLELLFDKDVPRSQATVWKKGVLPNINAHATEISSALQHDIKLVSGQEICIDFAFGLADNIDNARELANKFLFENSAKKVILESQDFYNEFLASGKIETEDQVLNTMLNTWSKIQLYKQVISERARKVRNWRNNLQDAWGWMIFEPLWAKKRLQQMCELAAEDGFLRRSSHRIPEAKLDHFVKARHNDIATWAVLVAARYAAETGDYDFFRKNVNYAQGKKEASIIQCLINAIQWMFDHKGQHGMILMLDGDWSDPLEEAGKKGIGESPWTSVALVNAIKNFTPLLNELGYNEKADVFLGQAKELADAVNEHAWDGQWYIRGITDDGIRFGKSDDPDANVSLMMQAWSIISGVVTPERMQSVLNAIDNYVKTEEGPILYGPPFLKWRSEIGRETVKRPGTGENGSVYVHGAMMLAGAEIAAGRPDEALKIIKQVLPLREDNCTSKTKDVPLWMPNFYHGIHSPMPGLSSGKISTGALAWFYLNICEGFLGVIPELSGMRINPSFPTEWNKASFTRQWRGSTYNFNYKRDSNESRIVVYLDGQRQEEAFIPIPSKNSTYEVLVAISE